MSLKTAIFDSLKRLTVASRTRRASLLVAMIVILTGCSLAAPIAASAITTLSQGYTTTDKVSTGSIVSLDSNSSDKVSNASSKSIDSILGVVINDGNSLLSVSTDKGTQIQVATSGIVPILVSDINGSVKEGDQITASPISGVGMKATSSIKVVGIAQGSLTSSNGSKQSYKDKGGQDHSVTVGQIPVLVNVSYFFKQPDKTLVPSAIQSIANALAGKPVDSLPIFISIAIFVVTLVVVVSIIYSIIHSSIISVGRNPMSQSAIYRNLIQLSALVVAILGVSIVSIYMVLTKF